MNVPYERVIQWLAGPFAVVVGGIAVKVVANWSFLGQIGLGKSTTAHAITNGVVFVTSSAVTYLAHHKWLDNLPKWWTKNVGTQIPGFDSAPLEARLTALERVQEPSTTQGTMTGDDNPDYEAIAQRRQDIAESMPMKDPYP